MPPQSSSGPEVIASRARRRSKESFPAPPQFKNKEEERQYLKGRLALAFRIFAKMGFDDGVAGHITVRDPIEPTCFWVNPFGLAWLRLKASDLILVDETGTVIDGGSNRLLNSSALMIHQAVHSARPDISCVAHSHSLYGRTFSAFARTIDIISQDSCAFHNDLGVYTAFRGVVLDEDEGKAIAVALGTKKAVLLQNHGILTCGQTIESAVFWYMSLEKCCHSQLLADAAMVGSGREFTKIEDEDAAHTYRAVGSERMGWFSAQPQFDSMAYESGHEYMA